MKGEKRWVCLQYGSLVWRLCWRSEKIQNLPSACWHLFFVSNWSFQEPLRGMWTPRYLTSSNFLSSSSESCSFESFYFSFLSFTFGSGISRVLPTLGIPDFWRWFRRGFPGTTSLVSVCIVFPSVCLKRSALDHLQRKVVIVLDVLIGTPNSCFLNLNKSSSIYTSKNRGLRTHPCATPPVTLILVPSLAFMHSCASASVPRSLMKLRRFPLIPFSDSVFSSYVTSVKSFGKVNDNYMGSRFMNLFQGIVY